MSQIELLSRLREELRFIDTRISEKEAEIAQGDTSMYVYGARNVLKSQRGFFADLIAQIEREGVTG